METLEIGPDGISFMAYIEKEIKIFIPYENILQIQDHNGTLFYVKYINIVKPPKELHKDIIQALNGEFGTEGSHERSRKAFLSNPDNTKFLPIILKMMI